MEITIKAMYKPMNTAKFQAEGAVCIFPSHHSIRINAKSARPISFVP